MSVNINLTFPVYIRYNGDKRFTARPLFLGEEYSVSARRYKELLKKLRKDIRQSFCPFYSIDSQEDDLIWLMFNPQLRHKQYDMHFKSGRRDISGHFNVVEFDLKGQRYVVLPDFDNEMVIPPEDVAGRLGHSVFFERILQRLFKNYRDEEDDWPGPQQHMATRQDSVIFLDVAVSISGPIFPFERKISDILADMFGDDIHFNGPTELTKTGYLLNDDYPDELTQAVGCDEMVNKLVRLLFSKENPVLVLVGPEGVGRSTLLQSAMRQHFEKVVSHPQHEWEQKQVWHLDPNRIIAGMSTVGAWQKRLTAMIESCRNRFEFSKKIALRLQRDILLFDNPVALLRVGKAARSNMCLANILKIYAEERSVGLVLEATPEEWRLVQELDRGFADLFQVIRVQEPDKAETVQILAARRCLLEQKYQCAIEHKAFALIIELHERHLQSAIRPGSQVRMLERLMARHADSKIQLADVMDDFRGLSHMYSHLFDSSKLLDPDEVGNAIKKGLVGQEKALHCLVDTVMMVKAGLNSPGKPVASYLFVGPTGVGKTEAAKALTRYLFEDEQHLVRFNMNEFMDNQAASRLIGGRGSQEGQLTVKVRYSSFCILLLDEIEKAHPDVHDLLLQVLGEGRLTDAMGRTTDFSHSIIIMTSNIGATDASKTIGFTSDGQDQAQTYRNKAEDFFRPEFFNRIDQVIDFHPLTLEETKTIIRLMITRLLTRHGFISRSVVLNVSEIALDSVASQGHDPAMGARAVKRNLEKEVTQLAAAKLVELPVGQPTVMDIYARYGKLVPKIHALQYAQVNPDYVEQVNLLQKLDRHCLKTLLEQFGQLQTDLDSYRDELENNTGKKIWTLITEDKNESYTADETRLIELYRIRETLIEYIEELQLFNEAEELEKLPRNPVRPFTVRKIKYYSRDWGEEVVYKDLFAQTDIRDYLNEQFQGAEQLYAKDAHYYLNAFLQLVFWSIAIAQPRNNSPEKVTITYRSCVAGEGDQEIYYLSHAHTELLRAAGIEYGRSNMQDNQLVVTVQHSNAYDLIAGEQGIHLFVRSKGMAVPLEVAVEPAEEKDDPDTINEKKLNRWHSRLGEYENGKLELDDLPGINESIIRLYALRDSNKRDDTITDLRTGLIQRGDEMDIAAWQLLFYSCLPDHLRLNPDCDS